MNITYQQLPDAQIFKLDGKLDYESHATFDAFIQQHYTKGINVVIDLCQLSYISSVGLRSLIGVARLANADKKTVRIKTAPDSMVKKIIVLSGFAKLMQLID